MQLLPSLKSYILLSKNFQEKAYSFAYFYSLLPHIIKSINTNYYFLCPTAWVAKWLILADDIKESQGSF